MNKSTPYSGDYYEDYYEDNYENEACNISDPVKFGQIFIPMFFSLVVILSVLGNSLVIMILVKYENVKSITNAFTLNLAISDLIFTTGLPFWVYYHMNGVWTLGEVACKSVNFVFFVGFYSSGFLLIIMTIHRYIAVVSPLSDIVSTKGLYCILAPILIWLFSIVVAIPYFIYTEVNDDGFCGYIVNSPIRFWGIYQQIALFILTSLVFIFCYVQIIWRLLHPTGQRRKSKTLKVIFALMVVFFLGWAPYNVVIFLKSRAPVGDGDCRTHNTLEYALNICRLGAFSHCCLNPVFYVFVGVKFKNHLIRFAKAVGHNSLKRNSSSVHSRHSRMTIMSVTSGEEMSL